MDTELDRLIARLCKLTERAAMVGKTETWDKILKAMGEDLEAYEDIFPALENEPKHEVMEPAQEDHWEIDAEDEIKELSRFHKK